MRKLIMAVRYASSWGDTISTPGMSAARRRTARPVLLCCQIAVRPMVCTKSMAVPSAKKRASFWVPYSYRWAVGCSTNSPFGFRCAPRTHSDGQRPQGVEHSLTDVQETGALRPHDPLVGAAGVEVRAGLDDVERAHNRRLGAVEREPDPFLSRASFAISLAGKRWPVVHVTWLTKIRRVGGDQAAMRSTLPCARSISGSNRRIDDAVALHAVQEAEIDRDVLVGRGDDLVALLRGAAR